MYDILNRVQVTNPTGKRKWAKVFNITDFEWKFIYTLPFQVCKDSNFTMDPGQNKPLYFNNKYLLYKDLNDKLYCMYSL